MSDQPEQFSGIDAAASERAGHPLLARYGRRAVILGAAAGGAGLAADLVAGGSAQAAADSAPPVLLGRSNSTTGSTVVTARSGTGLSGRTSAKGEAGVSGFDTSTAGAMGMFGKSTHGVGILGSSSHKDGIQGLTVTAGFSGVAGIDFCKTKGAHGIYGQSNLGFGVFGISFGGSGVVGQSNTSGQSAVAGFDRAPSGGTAVLAQSQHGTALRVEGTAKFGTSGVNSVPSGQRILTVKANGITATSKVLATIQKPQSGVFIEGAEPGNGSFTITLSKNASAALPVAWFVLE